jgi:hypothetical protein
MSAPKRKFRRTFSLSGNAAPEPSVISLIPIPHVRACRLPGFSQRFPPHAPSAVIFLKTSALQALPHRLPPEKEKFQIRYLS